MTKKIHTLVKEFKEAQTELMKRLKDDGTDALAEVAKSIFDNHPGLKRFAIVGSTPGWNDGEPCTHSSESFVGLIEGPNSYTGRDGKEVVYYTKDWEDYGCSDAEDFFLTELDDDEGYKDDVRPITVNDGCATLEQASCDVAQLQDIVQMIYDTNYLIKVSLNEDDTVTVEVDDYDCGY